MAKVDQYILRSGVGVYMGALTAGVAPAALAGYDKIAHIQGNVQINDQRNTVTVKEFDSSLTAFDLQFVDGRNGSISHNLNLVPGDPEHQALLDNYDNATTFALCIVMSDGKATANKIIRTYEVQIQNLPLTLNESGVSTGQITYLIQDKITNPTGT